MISKKMIFVLLILMISVNNSFGAEISMSNPYGLAKWVAPDGFVSSDPNAYENVLAITWNNNISLLYYPYTGFGSSSTQIFKGATGYTLSDSIYTPDYVFIVYSNGQVYRLNQWFGYKTWDEFTIGQDAILVTTVSTTSGTQAFSIDESGFIYVTGDKTIYKINPDTLTTTASIATTGRLYSLDIGANNMYTGSTVTTTSTTLRNYYMWDSLTSNTLKTYTASQGFSSQSVAGVIIGMNELTDGNFFIYSYRGYSDTVYYVVDYGNATQYITQLDLITGTDVGIIADSIVLSNGIGFITNSITDKVYTYEVGVGGIDFSGGAYVPAKIIYDTTDVYTDYQNYYNGSTVNTHYSLSFDLDDQETEFYSKDVIGNRFNWKIELIDPNGVLVNSYNIPENFDRESILSNTWFITSSIAFSSISPNGTYDLNLFEIDTNTNEKSLLDSTSFNILYEGTTGNTGIEETDSTNIVTVIISSVYFQAFILIMTCALAGGSVAGGAGLGGGGLIATVSCVFLGLLPYSFAFIIAIVCCAVVALAVADKIGGS